ncbi:MAG: MarR family transcriptional regulator [Azospirillaceae bacterium]
MSATSGRRGDPTPPDLRDQVSYMVRLIQISAYKNFEKHTTGFGSAPRYYGLLRLVEANPGITQSRLAEAIYLDRSSLVPILDTLESEGYLVRTPSETDKRVRCIALTPAGRGRLDELKVHVRRHEDLIVHGLTEEERAVLRRLLQRIDGNLRRADAAAKRRPRVPA